MKAMKRTDKCPVHPPVSIPNGQNKKAQVSIFIILAIMIVAGIVIYLVVRGGIGTGEISQDLLPVFEYYQGCIERETGAAIAVMESQGGKMDTGDYFPGSEYAPFSSQLNFLGTPVPYWYYVSGNGIIKEQVPTKAEMENEISKFISEGLKDCDFETFYKQGYSIKLGEPKTDVNILDGSVTVQVNSDLQVSRGKESARKTTHEISFGSKLGKFYNLAVKIYNEQKQTAFLEYYAVDVLRSYAPVDGTEIQCSPKVWSTQNVFSDLKDGLEQNLITLKFTGDYYDLLNEKRKYFVLDTAVDEAVNVMYSKNWPTKIEVDGDDVDDEIMMVQPVGLQEGMGMMGFCYVPYHFVYDLSFPVLFQIYDNAEMFQFPVVVVVDNNVPRQAIFAETPFGQEENFDLCAYNTQDIEVNVKNVNLNGVNANVSYECFDQTCRLGEAKDGRLVGKAPACVNGYLKISAEGYADKKELFSTNTEKVAEIILDREYELTLNVKVSGANLNGMAIVSFVGSDGKSKSVALPGQNTVKLSEGSYQISAYVYGNTSITIPASTKTECVDVPKSGLLGIFGGTNEKCFDVTIPATNIESALIGGGKQSTYLLESDLEKEKLTLNVDSLPKPNSVEDLAKNFETFETRRIGLAFG